MTSAGARAFYVRTITVYDQYVSYKRTNLLHMYLLYLLFTYDETKRDHWSARTRMFQSWE